MRTMTGLGLTILVSGTCFAQEKPNIEVIELRVRAAQPPVPALKIRLMPIFTEQHPGNAAALYMRSFILMAQKQVQPEVWDKVTKWSNLPAKEVPLKDAKATLKEFKPILDLVTQGARREQCFWDLNIRETDQPFQILLPEMVRAREVARLIALDIRVAVAENRIQDAVHSLQTGYVFARHVAQERTLMSGLVGLAVSHLMSHQISGLVESRESPNLYWALSYLPNPIVDLGAGILFEEVSLFVWFPELERLWRENYSKDQWDQIAFEVFAKARSAGSLVGEPDTIEWLARLDPKTIVEQEYRAARSRLAKSGLKLDAMPKSQVVLLDFVRSYEICRDDLFKWFKLPYSQAIADRNYAKTRLEDLRSEGVGGKFSSLLVPAMHLVHRARARAVQRVDSMRVIEALRLSQSVEAGRWPESLEDIKRVPVPADPLSGKPFVYRVEGDTATLDVSDGTGGVMRRYELTLTD